MKKLLLVSFIGIVLVGCGEKQITSEMLIGEWSCTSSNFNADWKEGKFQTYGVPKIEQVKFKYYMSDNILMVTSEMDGGHPRQFDLDEIRKLNNKEEIADYYKSKENVELNYISNDEYNFKHIKEVTLLNASEEDQNRDNYKKEQDLSCKRIK